PPTYPLSLHDALPIYDPIPLWIHSRSARSSSFQARATKSWERENRNPSAASPRPPPPRPCSSSGADRECIHVPPSPFYLCITPKDRKSTRLNSSHRTI